MQLDTDRPIDEVFDVQRDVEQNPCGALMAIHSLHATVIEQQAEIERLREAVQSIINRDDGIVWGEDHEVRDAYYAVKDIANITLG